MEYSVNFHQTFKPEPQYISSIVEISNPDTSMSVKEISSFTGIPNGKSSGKVEPHIYYANYMGLIEFEKNNGAFNLNRTALGEIVSQEDPGFQEELTLLLCHAMLCRNKNGALMWNAVFADVLPKYHNGVKVDLILIELEKILKGNINRKNFAPFIASYESMFEPLNLLTFDDEVVNKNMLHYNDEFLYLYGFILYELWDELFSDDEISEDQFKTLNFGKLFGFDASEEFEVLEHLAENEIIRINKQLSPFTILKLVDKDSLMSNLYSRLF